MRDPTDHWPLTFIGAGDVHVWTTPQLVVTLHGCTLPPGSFDLIQEVPATNYEAHGELFSRFRIGNASLVLGWDVLMRS